MLGTAEGHEFFMENIKSPLGEEGDGQTGIKCIAVGLVGKIEEEADRRSHQYLGETAERLPAELISAYFWRVKSR